MIIRRRRISKPPETFRERLDFYLVDTETRLGKAIDVGIIALNLVILAILVIETYDISPMLRRILWFAEITIVCFFIIEYLARLYGADDRKSQILDLYSIIDLVAILPTLILLVNPSAGVGIIKIIRSIRVFRIFRFLRLASTSGFLFGDANWYGLQILRLVLTIIMIFFVSAGFFYAAEHNVNSGVRNFGDAFYYTVVTLTTVGFGDIVPATTSGRWVTVLMIISGIIFIPWQAGEIIKEWLRIDAVRVACSQCGLRYHDRDASHCKACGNVIYQQYESIE